MISKAAEPYETKLSKRKKYSPMSLKAVYKLKLSV